MSQSNTQKEESSLNSTNLQGIPALLYGVTHEYLKWQKKFKYSYVKKSSGRNQATYLARSHAQKKPEKIVQSLIQCEF